MFYLDQYYIILVVPTIILSLLAQMLVKGTFKKYSKVKIESSMLGADVAKKVMEIAGVNNVNIERTSGFLTDHFDPRRKVLRLSDMVYGASSVSAAGVAAHEAGHAVQKHRRYFPLILRSTLVPAANVGSTIGPYLAIIGLVLSNSSLLNIGILLFSVAVAFYVITLPVEINASRRAVSLLDEAGILTAKEMKGVKKVLATAALTYLASALTQLASLLRLILISKSRSRN